ncbi:MAG: hypothetical protein O3C21_05320 [Verrucomicrobia bacterium]|nr:hypothetical protein [Verrucomicrobiota bacterium]
MPAQFETLRKALPENGLFAGMNWRFSPDPFPLSRKFHKKLEALGQRLLLFQRGCDEIYRRSHKGTLPAWIKDYLDAGKPETLLAAARSRPVQNDLPRIIRPDLLLLPDGKMALTEIDSVPGGIGLTGWLAQTYQAVDPAWNIVGGADGMLDGFASLFPEGADILMSRESADYRPEMEWLSGQLNARSASGAFRVAEVESYAPGGRAAYRFFELFDLPNIPTAQKLLDAVAKGSFNINAPMKPWLEEKMWLALFWSAPLRDVWERSLRASHRAALEGIIPYGWIVDPSPIPHYAVLPRLNAHSWDEVAGYSQAERQLVLKRSGFSEDAWGSRSVSVGHDLPQQEWAAAIQSAIRAFPEHPYVVQEFRNAEVIKHPVFNDDTGAIESMEGKVRLCPYYFVEVDGRTVKLAGVLATITPADKKVIHGMRDAIIAPCHVID